jgi:hypothetical protein
MTWFAEIAILQTIAIFTIALRFAFPILSKSLLCKTLGVILGRRKRDEDRV